jgi:hypothetical protein
MGHAQATAVVIDRRNERPVSAVVVEDRPIGCTKNVSTHTTSSPAPPLMESP